MQDKITLLKADIHEILGQKPSDIFLGRIDSAFDKVTDKETLKQATERVERLVRLFIGVNEAETISRKCREIL